MPRSPLKNTRIVSLTPSITETLYALGLDEVLVGVTDSCDFPANVAEKPHVASWFDPDIDKIIDLGANLVFGLKRAHSRLSPQLERRGVRVVLYDPRTMDEVFEDMKHTARLLEAEKDVERLIAGLRSRLSVLDGKVSRIPPEKRTTVARVLEWDGEELIVAGPGSFQYDVITRGGGRNVTGGTTEAYPRISFQRFAKLNPEMFFFCGTDKRFLDMILSHPLWNRLRAVKSGKVHQFPCNLTCRTGPRIVDMAELLYDTLYSEREQGE